jgi:hypothetical protein
MQKEQKRGSAGPRAIAGTIDKLTRPALARRGLAGAAVVAEWGSIVGPAMARYTCPLRIVWPRDKAGEGTLHLRVSSSALATELQHLQPQLLERINGFFGYCAVARLAISHGPLPRRPAPPKPPPRLASPQEVERRLAAVDNPDLKAALAGLAKWVLAK